MSKRKSKQAPPTESPTLAKASAGKAPDNPSPEKSDADILVEALNAPREDPWEGEEGEPDLTPTGEWSHGYVLTGDDSGEDVSDLMHRDWCERSKRLAAGKETPEDVKRERQDANLRAYAVAKIERRMKKRERAAARRREIENEERASYGLAPLEDEKAEGDEGAANTPGAENVKAPAVEAQADTPADKPTNMSGEARALAVKTEHPHWTDKQVAEEAGVHVKSLNRFPLYKEIGRAHV